MSHNDGFRSLYVVSVSAFFELNADVGETISSADPNDNHFCISLLAIERHANLRPSR
jgi:hypothetical protein